MARSVLDRDDGQTGKNGEIGGIGGEHGEPMPQGRGSNQRIEGARREIFGQRGDHAGVKPRGFQIERQGGYRRQNAFHECETFQPPLGGIGAMDADQQLRSGNRAEIQAAVRLVIAEAETARLAFGLNQNVGIQN